MHWGLNKGKAIANNTFLIPKPNSKAQKAVPAINNNNDKC